MYMYVSLCYLSMYAAFFIHYCGLCELPSYDPHIFAAIQILRGPCGRNQNKPFASEPKIPNHVAAEYKQTQIIWLFCLIT